MKWFLIGLVGVVCSTGWVYGQDTAPAPLAIFKQGTDAMVAGQYDAAAKVFDQLIKDYPTAPGIDEIQFDLGFCYLHLGKYQEAIDALQKVAQPTAKPKFRDPALYVTALAQFSQGQKLSDSDKTASNKMLTDAAATFATLIANINTTPTADNKDYLEDALYYQAFSQFALGSYNDAEKNLLQLVQQFNSSLTKPDYLFLLGNLYAVEANQAAQAKKPMDDIKALAQKALDYYGQVSSDPAAIIQANDANLSRAGLLTFLAQLDKSSDGFQKAVEAYRQVRRKDDLIQLQENRLADLKKASKDALTNSADGGAAVANANSRLISRETDRLASLRTIVDPSITALIGMTDCYVSMQQPDEARTILRRLLAHASAALTPEQQQKIEFQILYSYALGGQVDKANKALDDYLGKHTGDPQADSISYLIAGKLMDQKDYNGALAQADRSLKDFPQGTYVSEVYSLKAHAYTNLGQLDKAKEVLSEASKLTATGAVAIGNQLTLAQTMSAQGNLNGALETYQKVKNNPEAGEMQSSGAAGYINTLLSLHRYDEVISESKAYVAKYPDSKAMPSVLYVDGLALDQKNDPTAVKALQDMAKKYPKSDEAAFALSYIVTIYQRMNNADGMIQAATALRTVYPTSYDLILGANDKVSNACLKLKKFDDALALFTPLLDAPKPEVVAAAQNKIGTIWIASAKSMGPYQSLPAETRPEAEKRLGTAESSYLTTLKKFPDQLAAVGDAFEGLNNVLKQRRSWGLLTDADMEAYLGKITADLMASDLPARVELAKAGLVFVYKNGSAQYSAALDRFKKVMADKSGLNLTRQETDQYGDLLLAAKDYATAQQIYTALLTNAGKDRLAQVDGYYGVGASYLAQGDVAKAAENFAQMKAVPGGAAWHPHITDADFGLALATEKAGDKDGTAKSTYARLMQAQNIPVQAKSMLGYGRLLEKEGNTLKPADPKMNIEFAVHYYQAPNTLFGPAVPEVSAEGLFDAGQVYEKAGDKANAKLQYSTLISTYGKTAPDWAAKAQDALSKLGA